jgi:hypothetical protein
MTLQRAAVSPARIELEEMFKDCEVSNGVYEQLRKGLDRAAEVGVEAEIKAGAASSEQLREVTLRLLAASKSAIDKQVQEGQITADAGRSMLSHLELQLKDATVAKPDEPRRDG